MHRSLRNTAIALLLASPLFAQLGALDTEFLAGTGFGEGILEGRVETIVQQPDGKLLVGGWFSTYNGSPANCIIRLNPNGTADNSFNTGSGFEGVFPYVNAIALQPDGKILVGGNFNTFNGVSRDRIARLNADGSLDNSFDPATGFNSDVNSIVLQPDGKILVGGIFSRYDWLNSGGIARGAICRLNANGSLDNGFASGAGFGSSAGQTRVHGMILQPDGKVLCAGLFTTYDGVDRVLVARLNADGSLDNSFDAGDSFEFIFGFYGEVWTLLPLSGDRSLLVGNFSHTGAAGSGVVALEANGSLASGFSLNQKATTAAVQPDGKLLVASSGPYILSRYQADGSPDAAFPSIEFNDWAQDILVQTDGNIVVGGWFAYNPQGIVRFIGDSPAPTTGLETAGYAPQLALYPNPAGHVLHVELPVAALSQGAVPLHLLRSDGALVRSWQLTDRISRLDVADLPRGLYVLQQPGSRNAQGMRIALE